MLASLVANVLALAAMIFSMQVYGPRRSGAIVPDAMGAVRRGDDGDPV